MTTMALFGSAFASSKAVVDAMPHQVAAVLRFGGGAIILLIAVSFSRRPATRFTRRQAIGASLVGLLGVFAYNLFFFWGLSLAPSLDAVVLVPVLSPVLVTSYQVLTGRETAGSARIAGLLLGIAGAVVFFLGISSGGVPEAKRLAGDGIYVLGAVSWAAYSINAKKVLAGVDPLRATACSMVTGALALTLFAAPALTQVKWGEVSGVAWANAAYLAVGPTAVAHLFYYRGLRSISPSTATILMFVSPVFGTICSVAFLGETFTALQITGAVVMMCGAILAVTQGRLPSRGSDKPVRPQRREPRTEWPRPDG
jgi:drug/metabolite transporter (DMT)-like permease